jgi:hypothetical protein
MGAVPVPPAERRALGQVAVLTATLKAGERAGAATALRQAQNEDQRAAAGLRTELLIAPEVVRGPPLSARVTQEQFEQPVAARR